MRVQSWGLCVLLVTPVALAAQATTVDVETLACLPLNHHAAVRATVANEPGGSTVRLYFRRLNQVVEDFYYVPMVPAGGGTYWTTLPEPSDDELEPERLRQPRNDEERRYLEAAWWQAKEASVDRNPNGNLDEKMIHERASVGGKPRTRTWMKGLDLAALAEFLDAERQEQAEYYAAVFDGFGREIARSPMRAVQIEGGCDHPLDARQEGLAKNLVVGETAPWQRGKEVFHWNCDGIVSRIDFQGILREDRKCRACVVAWWKKKEFFIPVAAAGAVTGILVVDQPPNPSPSGP